MCSEAGYNKPIIYCVTAYTDDSFIKIAIASGMDDFFTKPINYEQVQMVKAILVAEMADA